MPSKILVIEDEPDIRKTLEYNLSREGYEVAVCGTLQEAKKLLEPSLSLLVLDLMLPDGSGLDLCREIKKNSLLSRYPYNNSNC